MLKIPLHFPSYMPTCGTKRFFVWLDPSCTLCPLRTSALSCRHPQPCWPHPDLHQHNAISLSIACFRIEFTDHTNLSFDRVTMTGEKNTLSQQLSDFMRFTGKRVSDVRRNCLEIRCTAGLADSELQNNTVFILVLGMTGSGKSTLIQQCTGRSVEIGHGLQSCKAYSGVDVHVTIC